MASLVWAEPGCDATFDTSFWSAVVGAPASSATQARTGPRSLKCDSGAGNATTNTWKAAPLADAGRCISFGMYIESYNTSDVAVIIATPAGHTLGVFNLRLIAASHALSLYDAGTAGTIAKAGTTALSLGQWYRISISYVLTTTTNWHIKVYINGTLEIDATNADKTLTRVGTNEVGWGWHSAPGASKVIYFDDFYIDDRTDLTDCGDIRVTAKRPAANGTANGLTTQIGAGGSGFGTGHSPQVNERTRSDSNGWSLSLASAGGTVTEEYSLEAASSGDVDISAGQILAIVGLLGWVQANTATASSNTNNAILTGTNTAITLTTTSAHYETAAKTTATYPGGNTDVGITCATSGAARLFSLFECGVIVAFQPRIPPIALVDNRPPSFVPRQPSYHLSGAPMLFATPSLPDGVEMGTKSATRVTMRQLDSLDRAPANVMTPAAVVPAGANVAQIQVVRTRQLEALDRDPSAVMTPPAIVPAGAETGHQSTQLVRTRVMEMLEAGNTLPPVPDVGGGAQYWDLLRTTKRQIDWVEPGVSLPTNELPEGAQYSSTPKSSWRQLDSSSALPNQLFTPPAAIPPGVPLTLMQRVVVSLLTHTDSDRPNLMTAPAIVPAGALSLTSQRVATRQLEWLQTIALLDAYLPEGALALSTQKAPHTSYDWSLGLPNQILTTPAVVPAGALSLTTQRVRPIPWDWSFGLPNQLLTTPAVIPPGVNVYQVQAVLKKQAESLQALAHLNALLPEGDLSLTTQRVRPIPLDWSLGLPNQLLTTPAVIPAGVQVFAPNQPVPHLLTHIDLDLANIVLTAPVTPLPPGVVSSTLQRVLVRQLDWRQALAAVDTAPAIVPAGVQVFYPNQPRPVVLTHLDRDSANLATIPSIPPGAVVSQGNRPRLTPYDWSLPLPGQLIPVVPPGAVVSQGNQPHLTRYDWSLPLPAQAIPVVPPGAQLAQGNRPRPVSLDWTRSVPASQLVVLPPGVTLSEGSHPRLVSLTHTSARAYFTPSVSPPGTPVISTPRFVPRLQTWISPAVNIPFLSYDYPFIPVLVELPSGLFTVELQSAFRLVDLGDIPHPTEFQASPTLVVLLDGAATP